MTGPDEELNKVINSVAGSDFGGMIIVADAGVGKTRLAREAGAAMAARGWAVRRVAGTPTGRSVTMGAFVRRTDGIEIPPLTPLRQVLTALQRDAGDRPLLVITDDAHLLDDLSGVLPAETRCSSVTWWNRRDR